MKFLPFFLAPFVLARVSNGSEAAGDDLHELFVETKKNFELQEEKVKLVQNIIESLDDAGKTRTKLVHWALNLVKKDDLKKRVKMVVNAEKTLRGVKAEMEAQFNKIAKIEKKLHDAKRDVLAEMERSAQADGLLEAAKSEEESQAEKIERAQELIRNEKSKNGEHAQNILSAEKLFREVKAESKLEPNKISQAEKFLRVLKKKGKLQADDLARIEPLLSVRDEPKKAKAVEAAKQTLLEIFVELKADWPKAVSAEVLTRGVMAEMKSHLKRFEAIIPLLEGVNNEGPEDSEGKTVEELLHDLKAQGKLRAKNIAEAEQLVKSLAN